MKKYFYSGQSNGFILYEKEGITIRPINTFDSLEALQIEANRIWGKDALSDQP